MHKLRLELEELVVESFSTGQGQGEGTIHGLENTVVGCGETMEVSCNASACPVDCATDGEWTNCCANPSEMYTCGMDCIDPSVNDVYTCISPCHH